MKTFWIIIAEIISMISLFLFARKTGKESEKVKSQDEEIERKNRVLKDAEIAKNIRENNVNITRDELDDELCEDKTTDNQ